MQLEPLEFHDHTLVSVNTNPATCEDGPNIVIVVLEDRYGKLLKEIIFEDCSNISFNLDFDILYENGPNNTGGSGSTNDFNVLENFVKNDQHNWNFEDCGEPEAPINMKLQTVKNFIQ